MKLFISYARIDKPYCVQLVNTLDVHEVWYDQRLYAGQQWWEEILRRLDWCEGFVFLLSPESVNSEYCMKELDIAIKLKRSIFPILTQPGTKIPPQIANIQYVDAVKGLGNAENVRLLLNSIYLAEHNSRNGFISYDADQAEIVMAEDIKQPPMASSAKLIGMAASALENAQYDRAVYYLKQAREQGHQSRFINIDVMLEVAEQALEKQSAEREAKREYDQILELMQYTSTFDLAVEAFSEFQKYFPGYDPNNISAHIKKSHVVTPTKYHDKVVNKPDSWEIFPMLKWLQIDGGVARMGIPPYPQELVEVEDFWMAQFPVTNEQFEIFLNDPDGYSYERWWCFSDAAEAWFHSHAKDGALAPQFKGHTNPRETVNWFEAIAFCNWLAHKINQPVTLPTLAQWQRAAVGDADTVFPWGNEYHADCCNTRENELRMTTAVNQYPKGKSPFGIYDLAGNVWEWTRDKPDELDDSGGEPKRAVIGGSYVSPRERAHASFSYFLKPESRYGTIGFRPVILPPSTHLPRHLQF